MKKILFLSALDFKEKSIQVIRKTPEAYGQAGWHVDYIVARDNLENGNYFYEQEINPEGINVYRIYWPFPKARAKFGRYFALILSKLSSFLVVLNLALKAKTLLKNNSYDVVYGYELQGVLATNLIKLFIPKPTKLVSRFQGTFLNEMFVNRQYARVLFNLDLVFAIRFNSDLLIMTNDGTQGNQAVQKIKGKKEFKMKFWVNGVEPLPEDLEPPFVKTKKVYFLSVSRLVGWKRVDRNLKILHGLKELGRSNFIYYVVGEGGQKESLQNLSKELGLQNNVVFVGGINHYNVVSYLKHCDLFLSMYDSSNVGNPLLEAIRANKIIITLANGDTSSWIQHKYNGLIYCPVKLDYESIAKDIYELLSDARLRNQILEAVSQTEKNKLWTWEERLKSEIDFVSSL